ncbi:MAG: hypothetical protein KAV25_09015 [Methanophagales archaeon]|nr:hypothetical protein [Methanophagales archaeon]
MKKKIGLTAITIITIMIMTIAFIGVASAGRPACPTPETQSIRTVTMIKCEGMVTHQVNAKWESSNVDLLNSPPLQADEVYGRVTYNEDLKALDGETVFVKDLGIDTGDTPNLNVMTSMGYRAGEIGALSYDESVSMTLIANPTATRDVILCPFASRAAGDKLPASCEEVSAGSSMMVTDVLATTRTKVGITESPVSLRYGITATGSGGAGTQAHGRIAAEFSVYAEEGSAENGGHWGSGNVSKPTLGSRLTYYERSSANGWWEFSKEMDYESRIRP